MNKQTKKAAAATEAAAAKKPAVIFNLDKLMREAQNFGFNLTEIEKTRAAAINAGVTGLKKTLSFAAAVLSAEIWYKEQSETFCSVQGVKKISKAEFIEFIGVSKAYYYRLIKAAEIPADKVAEFFADIEAAKGENTAKQCGINDLIKFVYPPAPKETAAESESESDGESDGEAAESESAATTYTKNLIITLNGKTIYERSKQTKQAAQISGEAAELMAVIAELKQALSNIEASEPNDAAALFAASGEAEKYIHSIEAAEIDEIDE